MDDTGIMNVLDSSEYSTHEFRRIAKKNEQHSTGGHRRQLTLRNNSLSHISYQTVPRPCTDQTPDKGCALSRCEDQKKRFFANKDRKGLKVVLQSNHGE